MYLKKIFLFSMSASALCGATLLAKHLSGNEEIDGLFLSKVHKATENIRNVSLNHSLDPNVSSSSAPFVYSLFSTNLTSFSNHFRDSFNSWYLFQWAESLLKGTTNDSFNASKTKIYNHLLSLRNSYTPSDQLTPKNWMKENHIITSSKDTLKSTFDEIFFGKLHLREGSNGSKEFKMDQAQKEAFGDPDYVDKIIEFQRKLFEFWLKNEKPRLYCRKSWSHSSSFGTPKLYKDDQDLEISSSPDFRFPDFHESSDEIKKFIKAEKTCEGQTLHTLSDLSKLTDGYELSGFLHIHRNNWSDDSKFKRNKSEFESINNPLEIFPMDSVAGEKNSEHSQWKLNADLLGNESPLKEKGGKILLNLVDIKGDQEKYSTFLRTSSGLVMLQKSNQNSEEAIRKTLLNWNSNQLRDKLKSYFHSHSLEFLGELLGDNENLGIFPGAKWSKSLRNLLKTLSEYLLLTEKNQRHGKLLEILSSATTKFLNTKFSDSKASSSIGLATPLQLPRNINKEERIEGMNFSNFSSLTTNDGDFPVLAQILGERKTPLEISKKLKRNIHDLINSSGVQKTEGKKNSHFFNDYLLDNVLHEFQKNEAQLKNHTLSILLMNELKFKIDDPDFLNNFISSHELQENLTNSILQELVEVFLANRYLKEKIENRLNYGGFKHDKNCIREIKPIVKGQVNASCSSRPQLNIKLKNYWFMKNHYFNQHAYELGSGPMFEYLKFLYTFSNLIKNDFSEFRGRASSKITSGRFGALVWANGVVNEGNSNPGEAEINSGVSSLKDEEKYFRNPLYSEIFNPFFSRGISLTGHKGPSNISRESLSAFADSKELYGFRGFHAQKIKDDDLSHVWSAIFDNFPKANPKDNKNYGDSPTGDISLGSAYGYSHGSETIEQILDSFRKMSTLENFLKTYFSTEYLEISRYSHENLEALRDRAKKLLLTADFSNKFKRATTRFSGHLQNPNSLHSIFQNQKYLIQRNSSSNEGHIVRIIQINKYDLGDGFQELIKVIGTRTLLKTLILMAENDEEMVNGIVNLLL